MWNREQQERLAFEERILQNYMPHFDFYDRSSDTYVSGMARVAGSDQEYQLWIDLPPHYPLQAPSSYVVSPATLPMCGGDRTINSLGASHAYHVLGNKANQYVKLCYYNDPWDPTMAIVAIVLRGHLWLDAYTKHLRTGRTIDEILTQNKQQLPAGV